MRMSEGIAPTLKEGISDFHNVFFFFNLSSLYGFCFKIHNRCERQVCVSGLAKKEKVV